MTTPTVLDCGHPDTEPDVAHTDHEPGCWGIGWNGCGCPNVCRACCPTCNPSFQEATG